MDPSIGTDHNSDLDPRIQIELEKLNSATDEINRLETELDEANAKFRILLNKPTQDLNILKRKLGSCIEKARPYYDALEIAKQAQLECQRAAVQFQRANEIHQAAKETVALAEQRFLSKQSDLQFDNAWQEMLNHVTIKVMEAESQKAESGREHQKRATLFNAAEQKVLILEQKLRRSIIKSRPYFEQKEIFYQQLSAQKERVENLQRAVVLSKQAYSESLQNLESISEEIHQKRRLLQPREPGVGAELNFQSPEFDLNSCGYQSLGSTSGRCSSTADSEREDEDDDIPLQDSQELDNLKQEVQKLALRPVEGANEMDQWDELNDSVKKLDSFLNICSDSGREECAQCLVDNMEKKAEVISKQDTMNEDDYASRDEQVGLPIHKGSAESNILSNPAPASEAT